jgi:DNA-binding NarL/FixJ family response regulator
MLERVLLADDDPMVRDGLAALLNAEGFRVVGTAPDGLEAVRLAKESKPDIAVLDLGMPQLNGLETTRSVLQCSPETRVIVLTMHTEDPYVIEALRAGARGYLLKTQATAHTRCRRSGRSAKGSSTRVRASRRRSWRPASPRPSCRTIR